MNSETHIIAAGDADFAELIAACAPAGYCLADGGVESADVLTMLRGLAQSVRGQFEPAAWMIVDGDEVVGLCSLLHAPDDAGRIAIGYGIAASRRGRGHCSAAIGALVLWAAAHPYIRAITAETAIANLPSHAVLMRNGFTQMGTRDDAEDGALYCWEWTPS